MTVTTVRSTPPRRVDAPAATKTLHSAQDAHEYYLSSRRPDQPGSHTSQGQRSAETAHAQYLAAHGLTALTSSGEAQFGAGDDRFAAQDAAFLKECVAAEMYAQKRRKGVWVDFEPHRTSAKEMAEGVWGWIRRRFNM